MVVCGIVIFNRDTPRMKLYVNEYAELPLPQRDLVCGTLPMVIANVSKSRLPDMHDISDVELRQRILQLMPIALSVAQT